MLENQAAKKDPLVKSKSHPYGAPNFVTNADLPEVFKKLRSLENVSPHVTSQLINKSAQLTYEVRTEKLLDIDPAIQKQFLKACKAGNKKKISSLLQDFGADLAGKCRNSKGQKPLHKLMLGWKKNDTVGECFTMIYNSCPLDVNAQGTLSSSFVDSYMQIIKEKLHFITRSNSDFQKLLINSFLMDQRRL